ncbi:MAG: diguanylate cyclase [Actinomycetota bacterium]|nr:diguanylate cyclase [Actinomycetota bacterium]
MSLAAGLIVIFLGQYIYYHDPRVRLNRIFFAFCIVAAISSFGEFMYRQSDSPAAAYFWVKLTGMSYILIIAAAVHFALVFTENQTALKKRWPFFLLYGSAVLLFVIGTVSPISIIKQPWGYDFAARLRIVYSALTVWSIFPGILPFLLCLRFFFKTTGRKHRQAALMSLAFIFPNIIGSATRISRGFGLEIPSIASIGQVFLVLFVAYAIMRYELFVVSPEAAAEQIITTMTESLLLLDATGRITVANEWALKLLGYKQGEIVGQSAGKVFADEASMNELFSQLKLGESINDYETAYRTKTDRIIPVLFSGSVMKNKSGEVIGMVGIAKDISESKRSEEITSHMARYDEVTDLPNRRLFNDRLAQALVQARQSRQQVAVLILELGDTKEIIETRDTQVERELLRAAGAQLSACLPGNDTIARFDDGRFGVVLAKITKPADADRIAEMIQRRFVEPFSIEGKDIFVSVDIGISIYPGDGNTAEALVANAHAA